MFPETGKTARLAAKITGERDFTISENAGAGLAFPGEMVYFIKRDFIINRFGSKTGLPL